MAYAALAVEMKAFAWSVPLALAQVALQSCLATAEYGVAYNASPRDEQRKPTGLFACRAQRALANLLETYPMFIGLALALVVAGRTGGAGADGAQIWIGARVAYLVVYLAGVPYLRSALWILSMVGLVMMLVRLIA